MTNPPIRSLAGKMLASSDDPDVRRLAGAVLGDDSLTPPANKTKADLERILAKVDGVEGQTERAALIRKQLESMRDE